MKVLTCWEIIQLFAEFGEATGKTFPGYRCMLVANSIMFIYTWHNANIARITVKGCYNYR